MLAHKYDLICFLDFLSAKIVEISIGTSHAQTGDIHLVVATYDGDATQWLPWVWQVGVR